MFTQLRTLLRPGDTVTVVVAVENETQLRVTVYPRLFTLDGEHGPQRAAVNQPLSIVATGAELDAEFGDTLAKYSASTNTLLNTLAEVEAAHKAAAITARTAPVKAAAAAKPAKAVAEVAPASEPTTTEPPSLLD
jgi:PRTRC genetic system protein E